MIVFIPVTDLVIVMQINYYYYYYYRVFSDRHTQNVGIRKPVLAYGVIFSLTASVNSVNSERE